MTEVILVFAGILGGAGMTTLLLWRRRRGQPPKSLTTTSYATDRASVPRLRASTIAVLTVLLLVLILVVVYAPRIFDLIGAGSLSNEGESEAAQRQALLLLLGGFLAAITALLSWQRHLREQETLGIERDRHWTGRYTEAVSHLDTDSDTVCFGSIYALERLALEARNNSDAQMIVNLLCAFVRNNSPWEESSTAISSPDDDSGPTPDDPKSTVVAAVESIVRISKHKAVSVSL